MTNNDEALEKLAGELASKFGEGYGDLLYTEALSALKAVRDAEREILEAPISLHVKSLNILADDRTSDPNVQESLRCAVKHLIQLSRELTAEREAREKAEAKLNEFNRCHD